MLQSIFIYTFLAFTMLWAAISYSRNRISEIRITDIRIIYIILIYGLICGIRFNVGVDYMVYYESYISYMKYGISEAEISQEPGWLWITKLLATHGFHYSIYFAIIAIAQISFVIFAFKNHPNLLSYVILVFFIGEWFIVSQNVLRQIVVTYIFLYIAIRHPNLPLYKSIIISLLAALIHTTGILICIFIPLIRYNWKKININPYILMGIYMCFAIIGMNGKVLDIITSNPLFTIILAGTDYQYYMTSNSLNQGTETMVGLGYLLKVIIACILFYQNNKIAKAFPNLKFKNWFYCYYISLCITALFPTSILFTRMLWFLSVLMIPVYAVFFKYCFEKINKLSIRTLRFQLGAIVLGCMIMLCTTSLFLKPEKVNMEYNFCWNQK